MTPQQLQELQKTLSGRVVTEPAALTEKSGDFGRMVRRTPGAVVRCLSSEEVAATITFARRHGIPVATRGEAHTQSGQALTEGGILLDLTSLNNIEKIDEAGCTVRCGAGVKWMDLVAATAGRGLIPPVLTNNLGVTVGGTLSVAGLGVASYRYGAQGDNVLELEVVTGTGDRLTCSPDKDSEVFDAVRSGLGQFGVITGAKLKLRPCKAMTRTYFLLYDTLPSLMQDAADLMSSDRFHYLESWCVPCPQGFKKVGNDFVPFAEWFFPLHATIEFDAASPPDDEAALRDLRFYRKSHVGDRTLLEFSNRLEPLFVLWKRMGYWANTHPWMETILPWQTAAPYIQQVLANLPPTFLGGGHVLLWPCRGTTSKVPNFMTPPGENVMGFGILPGIPPELAAPARARLNQASDASMMAGGKRYLSGLIEFDRPRWKQHFGERWPRIVALKKTYDPDGILNPGFIDYGE
ncbi:MAG TPA: FAD-binding protein [Candidatus Polarisedimenticolia bacterium]|nr:FAD-binding protein [Candidatus Polarisedimenticolia bacterium]